MDVYRGDWQRVADYIRAELARRQWTQEDLADAADVSTRAISDLLSRRAPKRMPRSVAAVESALAWPPGTVRALAAGDLDTDGLADVAPVEESRDAWLHHMGKSPSPPAALTAEQARVLVGVLAEAMGTLSARTSSALGDNALPDGLELRTSEERTIWGLTNLSEKTRWSLIAHLRTLLELESR